MRGDKEWDVQCEEVMAKAKRHKCPECGRLVGPHVAGNGKCTFNAIEYHVPKGKKPGSKPICPQSGKYTAWWGKSMVEKNGPSTQTD